MRHTIQVAPGRFRLAQPGEVQAPVQAPALRPPCVHLGPPTGATVACSTCPRDTTPPAAVHACAVRGRCAPSLDRHHEVTGCGRCSDYAARVFAPIATRHLLYHLGAFTGPGSYAGGGGLPVGGAPNGVWRRNVRELLKRWGLFNGRKIVAIVTGSGIEPPGVVRAAFAGYSAEFVEVRNDPTRREVATFLPLFERIVTDDPGAAILYAQAKGVTRPAESPVHLWTDVLHETHLDYWPHVARLLAHAPLAGCFKKLGRGWVESASDWHFSSSWFWFRGAELFRRADWRRIDPFWSGIEPYPSLHFGAGEAATIFHEGPVPQVNLYDWAYWTGRVLPALVRWRQEHADDYREWR